MRKIFYSLFLILFLGGCMTSSQSVRKSVISLPAASQPLQKNESIPEKKDRPQPEEVSLQIPSEPVIPLGMVFAKTNFLGVVQTSYVKLSIVDLPDPEKTYQLFIGDKSRQRSFPWKVEETVMPGYFFIELPPGSYAFHFISIPVGTTLAVEPMDVIFDVKENEIGYLGTLKVLGIQEKIRIGGVPVIRPGFEYRVQILDERDSAMEAFHQRYPNQQQPIAVRLMQVNLPNNFETGKDTGY